MSVRAKNLLTTALKLSVALGLVFYLVQQGKLDFSKLEILFARPDVFVITVVGWFLVLVVMISWRWQILLQGMELPVSFLRTIQLYMIGLFFNSTMPGAVGGDIVKAIYVMRDHQARNKTPAMLTILLDRIIGLMGLFLIGAVAAIWKFNDFWANPMLRPVLIMILGFFAFTVVFYLVVFLPITEERDPIQKFLKVRLPGFGILRKIYRALLRYKKRPMTLVYALLISIAVQCCTLSYFMLLTGVILPDVTINPWDFAAIYPVGLLATALPLAPGGLGVGHVAFDTLYRFIGLDHGADVFNIYLLASISLSCLGVIPYIFLRRGAVPAVQSSAPSAEQAPS